MPSPCTRAFFPERPSPNPILLLLFASVWPEIGACRLGPAGSDTKLGEKMDVQVTADSVAFIYNNERKLFVLSAIIGILAWVLIIVGTIGIALIYVLLGFLIFLFAHSALISYLRGTGVQITAEQFSDLHGRVIFCCQKLGVEVPPDAYLIHADGAFNAFATRFLGRNFIVLFSNVVDALEEDSEAINFYIGHELGHIHRKHLQWGPVLWPAGLLPLLGAAYSRAREYTCDSYGAACCSNRESVAHGIAALAAGDRRWRTLNVAAYQNQARESGRFWMSFHELTGDYPWLTKRMSRMMSPDYRPPGRSVLAWILASFIPRLGSGGGASLLVTVAIVGILAAVAIPAYQDYTIRAKVTEGLTLASPAKATASAFYSANRSACESNEACGLASANDIANGAVRRVEVGKGSTITVEFSTKEINAQTVILEPHVNDAGELQWTCTGGSLEAKYRPSSCRK